MELTSLAAGLNALFYQTDSAILAFYHRLAQQAGAVLTPFFSALTLTAWKGALLVLISLALAAFPRTRRTGICALLALVIGALCTNILLKRLVDRPRPYDFDPLLRQWWEYAGSHQEHGGSFPSGHTTAGCAFTTGFLLTRGRRWGGGLCPAAGRQPELPGGALSLRRGGRHRGGGSRGLPVVLAGARALPPLGDHPLLREGNKDS